MHTRQGEEQEPAKLVVGVAVVGIVVSLPSDTVSTGACCLTSVTLAFCPAGPRGPTCSPPQPLSSHRSRASDCPRTAASGISRRSPYRTCAAAAFLTCREVQSAQCHRISRLLMQDSWLLAISKLLARPVSPTVDAQIETRHVPILGAHPTVNSSGHTKPMYSTATSTVRRATLSSSAAAATLAAPSSSAWSRSFCSVRPVSTMSSTMMTWRPSHENLLLTCMGGAAVLDGHQAPPQVAARAAVGERTSVLADRSTAQQHLLQQAC